MTQHAILPSAIALPAMALPGMAGVTEPVMGILVGYWPLAVIAVAAVFSLGVWRRFRQGRDDYFIGIPPTTIPAADEIAGHPVAPLPQQPPVTARSVPPDDLRPAVAGRLAHKSTSPNAEAATVVDLAVRGHLRLQEVKTNRKGKPKDWYLIPSPGEQEREAAGYEADLLTAIFGERDQAVRMKGARPRLQRAFRELRQGVMHEADDRGLFTRPLHITARMSAGLTGRDRSLIAQMLVLVVTVLAAVFTENRLPEATVDLLWLASVVLALWLIVRAATNSTSYRRSATGRALYEQLRGFTEHLSGAGAEEPNRDDHPRVTPEPAARHEAGDMFSRYLPYAIALGVTDQWARTFAQAHGQTQAHPQAQSPGPQLDTAWYTTAGSGRHPGPERLAAAMAALARTTSAIAAGRGSGFSESDSDGGGRD